MEELGNSVKSALTSVGITEERVSNWLGAPCNCKGRIDKLNKLGAWATGVASGLYANAKSVVEEILGT